MTDQIELSVEKRDVLGKQVRQLRRDGLVPAVIHDHGKNSVHVSAVYQDLQKAYRAAGRNQAVKLDVNGKHYTAMIKDVELDPKKNTIKHVVFGAVSATEKVQAEIPVRAKFTDEEDTITPAEQASLILIHNSETVLVQAVSSKLPEELTYDAAKLVEVGDRITAGDIVLPSGVELKSEPEMVLVTVYEPSAVAAANDSAAGDAQPEDENAEAKVPADHETTIQTAVVDEKLPGGKKELPEDGNTKTAQ